jgi:UDP-glucose 4-epimerase
VTPRSSAPPGRVIILGHSGFIGGSLMRWLAARGGDEAVGRSLHAIDLADRDSAKTLIPLLDRDTAIVMCAAIKRQAGDTLECCRQNIAMTMNLSEVITACPIRRLIFMSSAAVYGEDIENLAITEATPINIRSYYGLAKITSEQIYSKVMADTGGSLVCLRPPTVYGPGEQSPSYGVGSFLRKAVAGESITLWGDGTELRGMVFIDDLVEVIGRLLWDDFAGCLVVAPSRSYSFKEALDVVQRLLPMPAPVYTRERSKQKVDNVFDNQRLRHLMPDLRFTDLARAVRLTYEREYTGSA